MSGVVGVLGRISDIGARFGAAAADPFVVVDTTTFDPFGAQYEAAVAAMQPSPAASAGAFTQSFAPAPVPAGLAGVPGGGVRGMTVPISTTGSRPPAPSAPSVESMQLAIDGMAGPPGQRPVGGYGQLPVPAELEQYGNGQIPVDRLTPIGQGGHRLFAPAAASWQNVVAAARADGIELTITDSYRSYDEQVDLANRKGLYQNGGLAAVPGTSNHGWGMAVDADVRDPATMEWLRVNGPRFGWVETASREPWHWEFRPNQV